MRVDQLMQYAWKVLIPFALLQIFLNGLILVYDLPDAALLVTSLGGAAAFVALAYYTVRAKPREPLTMVPVTAKGVA